MEYLSIAAIAAVVVIVFIALSKSDSSGGYGWSLFEPPHRAAGRKGERVASKYIESVLREGDYSFRNVSITHEGKTAELDNVIVNKYGVFIIEVKYYSGRLSGSEDDFEWTKIHISDAGNLYEKAVRNPIKQVKRQVYVFAKYLEYCGVSVWVDGYAMIIGTSSPVDSNYILTSVSDIDRAIHTPGKKLLNNNTIETIKRLLS